MLQDTFQAIITVKKILESRYNDFLKALDLTNILTNVFEFARNDIDDKHCKWYQEVVRTSCISTDK